MRMPGTPFASDPSFARFRGDVASRRPHSQIANVQTVERMKHAQVEEGQGSIGHSSFSHIRDANYIETQ